MNINWNSRFSFSGKCEHNCLELTWHPYGESKPCDPDSFFSVVKSLFEAKRWELGWEEIYLSYWIDLFLSKFQCSCIYFYLFPYKVMRSLVTSKQARTRLGIKNKPLRGPHAKKKKPELLYGETWDCLSITMINKTFLLLDKTKDSRQCHFETLQLSIWNVLYRSYVPSWGGGSFVSVILMSFYLCAAAIFHR